MDLQFALDYAADWRDRDRSRASDARADAMVVLADEVLRLRAIEAAIREDCWSGRDPHGTFERYLNAKTTT